MIGLFIVIKIAKLIAPCSVLPLLFFLYCLFGRNGSVMIVFKLFFIQWVPDEKIKDELTLGIEENKSDHLQTFSIDVNSIVITGNNNFVFKPLKSAISCFQHWICADKSSPWIKGTFVLWPSVKPHSLRWGCSDLAQLNRWCKMKQPYVGLSGPGEELGCSGNLLCCPHPPPRPVRTPFVIDCDCFMAIRARGLPLLDVEGRFGPFAIWDVS